jgi:hypothetical protein
MKTCSLTFKGKKGLKLLHSPRHPLLLFQQADELSKIVRIWYNTSIIIPKKVHQCSLSLTHCSQFKGTQYSHNSVFHCTGAQVIHLSARISWLSPERCGNVLIDVIDVTKASHSQLHLDRCWWTVSKSQTSFSSHQRQCWRVRNTNSHVTSLGRELPSVHKGLRNLRFSCLVSWWIQQPLLVGWPDWYTVSNVVSWNCCRVLQ